MAAAAILVSLLAPLLPSMWPSVPQASQAERSGPMTLRTLRGLLRTPPAMSRAQDILVRRCMKRAGYRYPTMEPVPATSSGYWVASLDPFTPAEAARVGYGTAIGRPARAAVLLTQRRQRYLSRLSRPAHRGYSRALQGSPGTGDVTLDIAQGTFGVVRGGCVSRAKRRIFGTLEHYLLATYLPQEILLYQGVAWRDPAVRRSLASYASCMDRIGYPTITRPDLARAAAEARFGTRREDAAPSPEERSLALADARCQGASSVVRTFTRALLRAAGGWFSAHEDDVRRILAIRQRAVERARQVVDRHNVHPRR